MDATTLIVVTDKSLRSFLQRALGEMGQEVLCASTRSQARALFRGRRIDLVVIDFRLADGCGFGLASELHAQNGHIPIIVVNGLRGGEWICPAGTQKAQRYFAKPIDLGEFRATAARALRRGKDQRRKRREKGEPGDTEGLARILGESQGIRRVREKIRKLAITDRPVLVVGETGTGKQLVAEALHRLSPRAHGPFVQQNCANFTDGLLGSELFGHEKGSFTGAVKVHRGLLEQAEGGTLFLDEISQMKPGIQAVLLRVLEGQPFCRVGGEREIRPDVRIISATNQDPLKLVREGDLRDDLFYRIGRLRIALPPLRDRGRDILLLARHFLGQSCAEFGAAPKRLTPEAEETLLDHGWPGNVRQLRSVMDYAVILVDTVEIGVEPLLDAPDATAAMWWGDQPCPGPLATLAEVESWHIRRVLRAVGGNLTEAARILGVHRDTVRAKLRPNEGASSPD